MNFTHFAHQVGQPSSQIAKMPLPQIGAVPITPNAFSTLDEDKADWSARAKRGWTPELREKLTARVKALKAAEGRLYPVTRKVNDLATDEYSPPTGVAARPSVIRVSASARPRYPRYDCLR